MSQFGLLGNYNADPGLGKFGGLNSATDIASTAGGGFNWLSMIPMVLNMLGGGNDTKTTSTIGGQQQPQSPSQSPFMPATLMQSRQMPSYGNLIQQMLAKQRGGM